MKYIAFFMSLFFSITSMVSCSKDGDAGAKSFRGDLDGTESVVNVGVYVNSNPTMKTGELLPGEIDWSRSPTGYSGDKLIGRVADGYSGAAVKDNDDVNGLFFKMQAIKTDHVEEIPVKVELVNGYWVGQDCADKIAIATVDSTNTDSNSDFCTTTGTASKDHKDTKIIYGQVSLSAESAEAQSEIQVIVHWKRLESNPDLENPDIMLTSMTVKPLNMIEGDEIEPGENPFYKYTPVPPIPRPATANDGATYTKVSLPLYGIKRDLFIFSGDGSCSLEFEISEKSTDSSFRYVRKDAQGSNFRNVESKYSIVDIKNVQINDGCSFSYGGFIGIGSVDEDVSAFQIDDTQVVVLALDGQETGISWEFRDKTKSPENWNNVISEFSFVGEYLVENNAPFTMYTLGASNDIDDRQFSVQLVLGKNATDDYTASVSVVNGSDGSGSIMGMWSSQE